MSPFVLCFLHIFQLASELVCLSADFVSYFLDLIFKNRDRLKSKALRDPRSSVKILVTDW